MKKTYFAAVIVLLCILLFPNNTAMAAEKEEKIVTIRVGASSDTIQEVLDYNKKNNYDLTIKIPAGTYELKKELRIYSNTTIIADENAILLKKHEKGAMLANDLSNDKGGYGTTENITIIGGVWDSKHVWNANTGTESFRFIHATNVTIKDAIVCNVPESSHLITFAGVKNGTVENCKIYGYKGTRLKEAVHLDVVHDDVVVPSMQAVHIKYDDLPCDGIMIRNNEIYDYPRAIGSHISVKGVFHKNISIIDNQLHNIDEAAIKAYNYKNVVIRGNTIKNASAGILLYTAIDNEKEHYLNPLPGVKIEELPMDYNITIEGNTIRDMVQYKSGTSFLWGDGIRVIGNKERPVYGVSIIKNKIYSPKRFGIYITYAPNSYVGSNTLVNTSRHAIYLDYCDSAKVYYNQVYSPGKAGTTNGGIGVSISNKVVVYKNYVKNAAKNGIFLYNKSTKCVISNNSIVASADNGISVNEDSNYSNLKNNKIIGNVTDGINNRGIFVYKANYASISYNTISKCKKKQEINVNNSKGSKLYKNTIVSK